MDGVAHVLWTNAVFYGKYANDRRQRYWAAFFGVLPDLIAFTPLVIYIFYSGLVRHITVTNYITAFSHPSPIYDFTNQAYNYTHSLVVFAIAFVAIWLARRGKPYWPMLGWALHIVIDIFTHHDFYQTPFLYPLSGFKNNFSLDWSHLSFMAVNYICLAIVYIIIWRWQKRRRLNANATG